MNEDEDLKKIFEYKFHDLFLSDLFPPKLYSLSTDKSPNLKDVVTFQVNALLAPVGNWESNKRELPDTRDLTSYKDAYASAIKNCKHDRHVREILYRREYICLDCNKYITL